MGTKNITIWVATFPDSCMVFFLMWVTSRVERPSLIVRGHKQSRKKKNSQGSVLHVSSYISEDKYFTYQALNIKLVEQRTKQCFFVLALFPITSCSLEKDTRLSPPSNVHVQEWVSTGTRLPFELSESFHLSTKALLSLPQWGGCWQGSRGSWRWRTPDWGSWSISRTQGGCGQHRGTRSRWQNLHWATDESTTPWWPSHVTVMWDTGNIMWQSCDDHVMIVRVMWQSAMVIDSHAMVMWQSCDDCVSHVIWSCDAQSVKKWSENETFNLPSFQTTGEPAHGLQTKKQEMIYFLLLLLWLYINVNTNQTTRNEGRSGNND